MITIFVDNGDNTFRNEKQYPSIISMKEIDPKRISSKAESQLALLKKKIEDEVFFTKDTHTIIDGNGGDDGWIFDFRKVTLQPQFLNAYADVFFEKYQHKLPFQVGGLEVASIPLITAVVMKFTEKGFDVNGFYIRKSRKKKGLLTMIEGVVNEYPIILIDDLISSGGSFVRVVEVLEKEIKNLVISDVVTILRYRDNSAYDYFSKKGINVHGFFELNDFKNSIGISNVEETSPAVINPFPVVWGKKEASPHLWKVRSKSGLLLHEGSLYYGDDNGCFVSIDESSGKELWRFKVPGLGRNTEIFSRPVVAGDSIFFGCEDGNVYALSRKTGEKIWIYTDADWADGNLAISKERGLVYVGLSYGFLKKRGKVVALDIKNGKVKWEFETKTLLSSGVFFSIKKNIVYFSEVAGIITVLNARSGSVIWSKEIEMDSLSAPVFSEKTNELVVAGLVNGRGKVAFLSADAGKTRILSDSFSFGIVNNPVIFEDFVFISSLDKNLYVIDQKTGQLTATFFFGSRVFSDPCVFVNANNKKKIFIGANDARLYEIDIEMLRVTSITYFTERITDPAVVSKDGNSLYLITYANEIYKLNLQPSNLQ